MSLLHVNRDQKQKQHSVLLVQSVVLLSQYHIDLIFFIYSFSVSFLSSLLSAPLSFG